MDLTKAFYCIPYDLLVAKCSTYEFDKNSLRHLYSYVKTDSNVFKEITSEVSRGPIVGLTLLDAFPNNFFYKITIASAHNLANHNSLNTLIDLAKNIHEPVHSLKLDSETSIKCLSEDFNGFLHFVFSIGNDSFIIEQFFKRLGIDLGKQLKFNLHINKTCKSASNEDNASDRLFWDRNSWIW